MGNLDPAPVALAREGGNADGPELSAMVSRRAPVGESTTVSRYLPSRGRTTVGAWCFVDHYGPDDVAAGPGMQVGPHPHVGLQTATWLFDGEVVHRDSLGTEQAIRPGQLNLMTAGSGIAHAETSPPARPPVLHGLQLWVALPSDRRSVAAAFEHQADLPVVDLGGARATVLVGEMAGARSPATVHSALVGAEIVLADERAEVPLDPDHEHAVLVVDGTVAVEGARLPAGSCAYLGRRRRRLSLAGEPAGRLVLLGGEPFTERLVMWWNFVGGTSDEVVAARADWEAGRRFGQVAGFAGEPVPAPPLPPGRLRPRGQASGSG